MPGIEEQFGAIRGQEREKPFDPEKESLRAEAERLRLEDEQLKKDLGRAIEEAAQTRAANQRIRLVLQGAQEHILELKDEIQNLKEGQKKARYDALTGLLNRNAYETISPYMFDMYQSLVRESYAFQKPGARPATFNAIYLDLNDFKPINDSLGHAAGDQALKNVANAIRSAVRGTDKIFRMGGDEFLILFVGHEEPVKGITTVVENKFVIAERISKAMQETGFDYGGTKVPALTASIGAVTLHEGETLEELVARADGAAYEAKKSKQPGISSYVVEGLDLNGEKK